MKEIRESVAPYIYDVLAVLMIILWILFIMGNLLFGLALGSIPFLLAMILRKLDKIEKG